MFFAVCMIRLFPAVLAGRKIFAFFATITFQSHNGRDLAAPEPNDRYPHQQSQETVGRQAGPGCPPPGVSGNYPEIHKNIEYRYYDLEAHPQPLKASAAQCIRKEVMDCFE